MIIKEIQIKERKLRVYIGINQISLDYNNYLEINKLSDDKEAFENIFKIISIIQDRYKDSILQFVDDSLILNEKHISTAVYYVEKAFQDNVNISNKKNMELLLYLATKRQIKKGIESFGMKITNLKEGSLTYITISPENNINEINQEILNLLRAKNEDLLINIPTIEKYNRIFCHFKMNNNQINAVRSAYRLNIDEKIEENLDSFYLAMHDLLCEKMSILSLEKIKID